MEISDFKVVVINLDSRPDRLDQVSAELPKIGIEHFVRFPGIVGGALGSVASHLACIKNGTGPLLLFEDDVCFDDGAKEVINSALGQLPEDFDMFYMGYNILRPATRYSKNLCRVTSGVYSNHAILYSEKARQIIRSNYDPETNEISPIFDIWLFEKGQSMMNCFICTPMVAFQRAGYSDVLSSEQSYREPLLINARNNIPQ